ncbi:MAG: PAS domain S-box protein [Leptolyngbyaceae cyanobacterium bins.59]|nr:PAS domain S-box protein [Leptolyngbyaceae cyanobacterium bins.59]
MLPGDKIIQINAHGQSLMAEGPAEVCAGLVRMAATICQTPIAGISQWDSLQEPMIWVRSGEESTGYPNLTALQQLDWQGESIILANRTGENSPGIEELMAQNPSLQCYFGVVLLDIAGNPWGLLSVMDRVPRSFSAEQQALLQDLGRQGEQLLKLQHYQEQLIEADRKQQQLQFHLKEEERLVCNLLDTTDALLRNFVSTVLDTANALVVVLDREARILRFNELCERVTQFALSRIRNRYFYEVFVTPEQVSAVQAVLAQVKGTGTPISDESRCVTKGGSERTIIWSYATLLNIEGQISYLICTGIDVTDRKRAEDALYESERQYRSLISHIKEIIFQVNQEGVWTFLNPAWSETTGFSLGETIGTSIWEYIHPDDLQVYHQHFQDLFDHTTERCDCEIRIRTQEGEFRWFQVYAYLTPIGSEHGFNISGTLNDITDRHHIEIALRERSQLSTLMAEVSMVVGEGGGLSETLDRCAQAIAHHQAGTSIRIWSFDPNTSLLELQAIAGQHSYTEDFPSCISLGISIIGLIAQSRRTYLSNDAVQDVCIGAKTWLQEEEISAFAGYPLVVDDRLMGVMVLFSHHSISEAMHHTTGWIASSIAVAIDRAWAREALLSRREALLLRLGNQIRQSLDLDTILQTVVTEIRSLLHVDCCHFLWCWPQPDHPSLAITHEDRHESLPSLLGEPSIEQVMLLTQTILDLEVVRIDDVEAVDPAEGEFRDLLLSLGITSQLFIPLETRSGQFGAIVCSHCSGPRPWTDSEVELLQAVTDQLAIAMDQAELYAQTRAAALAAQTQALQLTEAMRKLQATQTQLVQTEKMSSLGQMVAGVAHEINNPVNFILGNIVYTRNYVEELLTLLRLYQEAYPEPGPAIQEQEEEMDLEFVTEDLMKVLSSMEMGAERIRQIVLSLRNFSRLDEAEMKPVDIHEGIDSTLLILQNRLKSRPGFSGIEIVKNYGDLPPVECYAGQLNQVFMNILSNSIDALEGTGSAVQQGENTIMQPVISIETRMKDGNSVVIHISDNGPGMSEEVRHRLFDPFFTTKPVGKGTGLGLSISYQIVVDKHKGNLRCDSKPGQGAEFYIEIPIAPPARSMTRSSQEQMSAGPLQ